METTRLLYKELFTIRFLHEGYSFERQSFIADNIRILPDTESRILMTNLNIGYRLSGNNFLCFIRSKRVSPPANQPQSPFIENTEDMRLRFLLLASASFIAKTFIVHAGGKWVYHFSNLVNHVDTGPPRVVYLHQQLEAFNIANDYLAGTLVKSGGNLFAARKSISHLDAIAITNSTYWENAGDDDAWVNNGDLQKTAVVQPDDSCFGVIDIHNAGVANDYKLFNTAGQLLSSVYTLSLKSRF